MSDVKKYIAERKGRDREFAEGFDDGYTRVKIGAMLRKAREVAGLSFPRTGGGCPSTRRGILSRWRP